MVNSSTNNSPSYGFESTDMDIDGAPRPVLRVKESQKGLFVSMGHLMLFWSFTAGMMVFIFVVGYHAGRTKGRDALLEDVSKETARLPIVSTMPSPIGSVGQAQDLLSLVNAQATKINPEQQELVSSKPQAATEQKYDFAAPEKLPSANDVIATGWYLQVGAASNITSAQSIAKTFEAKKYSAKVKKVSLKDKALFQVLVGPYNTRANALAIHPQIKSLTKVGPFAVKIQ